MTWDWTRVLRGLALAAWGGFFVYLLASGRATTYIGPRTTWVVTLGAIALPLVAAAYLWGAPRGAARVPSVREVGANGLLVAPILLALMVPAPSLGALAVENKRARTPPAPLAASAEGDLRLYEIAWAADSTRFARANEIAAGDAVDFVAFVSARPAAGRLELSRFYVSCCAADATAFSVTVDAGPGAAEFAIDTWVRVKGTLAGRPGRDLAVDAREITEVPEPSNPYG